MKYLSYLIFCCLLCLYPMAGYCQLSTGFTATPAAGCPPLVVNFTNTTTPATGTTYSWSLGNGTGIITLTDPSTSYLAAGTYTVTLTATNGSLTSTYTRLITVYPAPTIHFSADDTSICPRVPVNFSNTTTGGVPGPLTYLWSFGDGTTNTVAAPAHAYGFGGHFSVTLNATNTDGCTSIYTIPTYVHVFNAPISGFAAPHRNVCNPPATVAFSSLPTGVGPFSYYWLFGDGSLPSGLANPMHQYNATGSYTVSLAVTDAQGCRDTFAFFNFVNVANFIASFSHPDSACINTSVTLTNTSMPFTTCLWLYGDGASDTTTNGHHTWHTAGLDTVKLVTYNGNCYDTVAHTIYIQSPASTFSITPVNPCPAPVNATFTTNVLPGSGVLWDFGDHTLPGSGSPASHTYQGNRFDTVFMYVTSSVGCKDTATTIYKIYDLTFIAHPPFFQIFHGCAPHTDQFIPKTGTSVPPPPPPPGDYPFPVTLVWNFGDGSPLSTDSMPTHTYIDSGAYRMSVVLTTSNGCVDTFADSIFIGKKPSATFTATPTHVCHDNNEIEFTAVAISGNPNAFNWLFGEGYYDALDYETSHTVFHHFENPGVFSDTLIAYNNYCPDTFIRHNYITIDSPTAKAEEIVHCTPANTISLFDYSLGDNTHTWYFGDGTSSNDSGNHHYPAAAIYNGMLTTFNIASGCRDTFNFTVNLSRPAIRFSTPDTTICRDEHVTIHSILDSGYVGYYHWVAGGISPNTGGLDFTDTFHSIGYYTIKLIVTDQNLCADTVTRLNYILVAKPAAQYTVTPTNACWPGATAYTDASSYLTGTFPVSFQWKFGDSLTAVTATPSIAHSYTAAGNYSAREIVTDNIGCKDTITHNQASVFKPKASFSISPTVTCVNTSVYFANSSSGGGLYSWAFGDGATSTLLNPVHQYTATGTYTTKLVITDTHGCSDSSVHVNSVSITRPHSAFTIPDSVAICPPFTVPFNNTTTGGLSYKWKFGNGDSSIAASPTCLYTAPGYDTVRLIAKDAAGCSDTAIGHIKIFGYAGSFTYGPDSGCIPRTVLLHADLSTIAGVSSVTWDFSDGITSSGSLADSTTHTYITPGAFVPKLIISGAGCESSNRGLDTIRIDGVRPGFIAAPNPICTGMPMNLTDSSSGYWSHITAMSWSYSGATSTADSVITMFSATGSYTITHSATDGWGCSAADTQTVAVYAIPPPTLAPDSVICARATTIVSDSATGGTWTSGNTTIASVGSASGQITGIAGGRVLITYTLPTGCRAYTVVTVNPYPDPGTIIGKKGICPGDTLLLTESMAGGEWSISNPHASINAGGELIGISSGLDTVRYTVANGNCDSSAARPMVIYPLPSPGIISGQSPVCIGAKELMTENVPGGRWSSGRPAVVTIDSTGALTALALGVATIIYTTAPDTNGCIDKTSLPLLVINPDFTVSKKIREVSCYNDSDGSIQVVINGGKPPFTYLWSTGAAATAVTNLLPGRYFISIKETTTQCIVADTTEIIRPDSLQLTADITDDICNGKIGKIEAAVTGGIAPYLYDWKNVGSGATLANMPAGSYLLTVTDSNNCKKSEAFYIKDTCNLVIVHNAISPNGDGYNDTWVIENIGLFPANNVQVFDKWGDEVFSASNYQNDWGGMGHKGTVPDGTYYYLVKLNTPGAAGGGNVYKGALLIKR